MGCPGESRGFFFTKKKTGMPYPDILNGQQCRAADPAADNIHHKEPEKLQHHKSSGSLAHVGKSEGSEKIQTDPPISMKNSKAPEEHHADPPYSSVIQKTSGQVLLNHFFISHTASFISYRPSICTHNSCKCNTPSLRRGCR